ARRTTRTRPRRTAARANTPRAARRVSSWRAEASRLVAPLGFGTHFGDERVGALAILRPELRHVRDVVEDARERRVHRHPNPRLARRAHDRTVEELHLGAMLLAAQVEQQRRRLFAARAGDAR